MAITKITAPSSIPATVADYQSQNSHLMAFINQINSQAFILSDPNGTVAPTIKQGAYISHGGSLYIVDTADATISGSPSDGTVYVRVSGTDTITAEYVTDISSYAWSSVYNAMISGSYTLLPYMLIKSGTSWTKYRFEQHKQATGNAIIDGHDIDSELDTLNGRVNQGVKTTDSPTFANSTIGGHNIDSELDTLNSRVNQGVKTTDSPTFAKLTLTTSTYGSEPINYGTSWVIPVGIYVFTEPYRTADLRVEVFSGSDWEGGSMVGGVLISDGSNVRISNVDTGSTLYVYYRKFS